MCIPNMSHIVWLAKLVAPKAKEALHKYEDGLEYLLTSEQKAFFIIGYAQAYSDIVGAE